jgi:hypothetical protein
MGQPTGHRTGQPIGQEVGPAQRRLVVRPTGHRIVRPTGQPRRNSTRHSIVSSEATPGTGESTKGEVRYQIAEAGVRTKPGPTAMLYAYNIAATCAERTGVRRRSPSLQSGRPAAAVHVAAGLSSSATARCSQLPFLGSVPSRSAGGRPAESGLTAHSSGARRGKVFLIPPASTSCYRPTTTRRAWPRLTSQ